MATHGIAAAERRKIALSWALFMAVPAPATPEVWAKPAMENTPPVLAHHLILGTEAPAPAQVLINTPAPVRVTPAVPALPAAVSIPNAIVQVIIVGMVAVVLFLVHQVINIHAPVPATLAAPTPLAAESILPAFAPAVMNGKMVVARNKHRMEQLASCIIAMAKLLVYVLQVWASMSQ